VTEGKKFNLEEFVVTQGSTVINFALILKALRWGNADRQNICRKECSRTLGRNNQNIPPKKWSGRKSTWPGIGRKNRGRRVHPSELELRTPKTYDGGSQAKNTFKDSEQPWKSIPLIKNRNGVGSGDKERIEKLGSGRLPLRGASKEEGGGLVGKQLGGGT